MATVSAIPLSRRAIALASTRKLFLRAANSAVFSAWWEQAWEFPSCRRWPSTRNRDAASYASTIPPPFARLARSFSAGVLSHARITHFSRTCAPRRLLAVREAHSVRSSERWFFNCWIEIPASAEPHYSYFLRRRGDLAFFHGNRHVVKIQCHGRLVKQFQPHGRIEEPIRLMHIRRREVHERCRTAQDQAAKTFFLRRSFFHLHSAVREGEIPGFGSLRRPGKLQFLDRRR